MFIKVNKKDQKQLFFIINFTSGAIVNTILSIIDIYLGLWYKLSMNENILSKDDYLIKIKEILKKHMINENMFFDFLLKHTETISKYAVFYNKYTLQEVKRIFKFKEEQVCVKDFENGSRLDLGNNLLSSMTFIGRNNQTVNLIENFDFNKFKEGLKSNPIQMLEINGKYFLDSDGNHRMMALKFLYYMEMANLNANMEQINKKFTFTFPVKHLNHDFSLIEIASKIMQKQSPSRFPSEYFVKNVDDLSSFYSILTFNKDNQTYDIDFQGNLKQNLNVDQTISHLSKFVNYENPYSIYNLENGFAFEEGNTLTLALSKEKLKEKINSIDLSQKTFPTEFLAVKKNENLFDLIIPTKTYYGDEKEVLKIYSAIVQTNQNSNLEIENIKKMSKSEVEKVFLKNLDIVDINLLDNQSWVKIVGREYKNISKNEFTTALEKLTKERHFCPHEKLVVETKDYNEAELNKC